MRRGFTSVLITLGFPAFMFAQDGQALYRAHCASCHEASSQTRAPSRDALRGLTPERILDALEAQSGAMLIQGQARTSAERRALAVYLSGKPFGTEKPPDFNQAACKQSAGFDVPSSAPNWNGWSASSSNSRFQDAAAAGIDINRLQQLKLKWAFAYSGDVMAYAQATVVGGRVFVGSSGHRVYSLDAASGCIHWMYMADAAVRSAISIGPLNESKASSKTYAAYFGDLAANMYALDAATGELLWKTSVDKHHSARITGAPRLYDGKLYIPVASLEEASAGVADYECCTFRGSVVALDVATGKQIWKTYTINEQPRSLGKNKQGVQQFGPSGVGVWASPTLDTARKIIYIATGDNYSLPPTRTSDAVIALSMDSGKMLWVRQLTEKDSWNVGCMQPTPVNCPKDAGPDFDFGSSPILADLPNGKRALIAGQKSGIVYALDPDREGELIWQVRLGQGGVLGGIEWGPAADDKNAYVALSDAQFDSNGLVSPKGGGGLFALQLTDGKQAWHAEPVPCPENRKGCTPAQSAAVSVIPNVVFSGSLDGHLRAYSTTDGHVLWDYDTARDFQTVNGVPGHGGAINGPGATIAGGMVFVNSGYAFFGQIPGNVLLAFGVQ
jgi:polyvinyl alcohol dehydrogenase (cytochrome)